MFKPPNKALQKDKGNLSCLLHSQKPRQLVFAAELGRWAAHLGQRLHSSEAR
jgi:hypothetical protein